MARTKPYKVLPGGICLQPGTGHLRFLSLTIYSYGLSIVLAIKKYERDLSPSSFRSQSEVECFRTFCCQYKLNIEAINVADKKSESHEWVEDCAHDLEISWSQLEEEGTEAFLKRKFVAWKSYEEWKKVNCPTDPKAIQAKRAEEKRRAGATYAAMQRAAMKDLNQTRTQAPKTIWSEMAANAPGEETLRRGSREKKPANAAGEVALRRGSREKKPAKKVEAQGTAVGCDIAQPCEQLPEEKRSQIPKETKTAQLPNESLAQGARTTKEDEMAAIAAGEMVLGTRKRRAPEKLDDEATVGGCEVVQPAKKQQRLSPAPATRQKIPASRKQPAQDEMDLAVCEPAPVDSVAAAPAPTSEEIVSSASTPTAAVSTQAPADVQPAVLLSASTF